MTIDIIAINPKTNKVCTFRDSRESDLRNVNGKQFYFFNNYQPLWEVVRIEKVSQERIDAEDGYFAKYGSACE
jgi:hypothetical protein